jgi:hypothetical protein
MYRSWSARRASGVFSAYVSSAGHGLADAGTSAVAVLRQDVRVVDDRYSTVRIWLRNLPNSRQPDLAVALASLVEPFATVCDQGQPALGLPAVAQMVRDADDLVEVDRARHLLFATPELAWEDEPEPPAWFPYRATIAWIYAADSRTTAPSDGVVNVFKAVLDLLDRADETLGDTTLAGQLMDRLDRMRHDGTTLPERLDAEVRQAARRLRDDG